MYGINKSASNFNFQSPRNLLCLIRPLNLVVSCDLITSRGDQVTSTAFTDDYPNSRLSLGELLTRGSNFSESLSGQAPLSEQLHTDSLPATGLAWDKAEFGDY